MKKYMMIFASMTLAACGGGGGGDSSSAPVDSGGVVDNGTIAIEHLELVNQPYAFMNSVTGSGVTVAVIDSGVNITHDEFGGKTLNQYSGSYDNATDTSGGTVDIGPDGLGGFAVEKIGVQEDLSPSGHGTQVASQIFGETTGVSPGVDLIMLDVYEGTSSSPDVVTAKGLLREVGNGTFGVVDFVNASLTQIDWYEDSAFRDERPLFAPLDTAGVGFIVAAGNFGVNLTEAFVTNPIDCYALTQAERTANFNCKVAGNAQEVVIIPKDAQLKDNFLWVGAVDLDLSQPEYLQNDGTPDGRVVSGNVPGSDADIQARFLVALGVNVNGPINSNDTDYFRISGTSHAAPVVTGAAALVKSQHPTASNEAVLQILLDSADSSFAGYDPELHGQGLLDIEAALILADNTVF